MDNIKLVGEAVCFANGWRWKYDTRRMNLTNYHGSFFSFDCAVKAPDFQLNEIQPGDYIEASELDTEQKYNDAVAVFELFRAKPYLNCDMSKRDFIEQALKCGEGLIVDDEFDLVIDYNGANDISQKSRKITYPQLMAIGKLKRAMIELDSEVKYSNRVIDSGCYNLNSKSKVDGNKYHRTIYGLCGTPVKVDVYRVSDAFQTGSAPIDHAVKKMLCAGLRGHKDKLTDIDNAIESLQAERLLLIQKGEV